MDKEKAKLYIDIAEKYLKKYGKDNAHERIKDAIDILHEFYKDGNDIGNSIGILGRIDAIILQEKAWSVMVGKIKSYAQIVDIR